MVIHVKKKKLWLGGGIQGSSWCLGLWAAVVGKAAAAGKESSTVCCGNI